MRFELGSSGAATGAASNAPSEPRRCFDAFSELNVCTERVIYADEAVEEVRRQLVGLDGVLVWVNPIQDGANRAQLDGLLRSVAAAMKKVLTGHPSVARHLGC